MPVHETSNGETVWAGEVQVFDLVKHSKAKRAYTWSHATTGTRPAFGFVQTSRVTRTLATPGMYGPHGLTALTQRREISSPPASADLLRTKR